MKRFWRVIMLLTLALALPLRVSAMPISECCLVGMDVSASHAMQNNATPPDAGHGCNANNACSDLGHPAKMSHASCTVMCATVGAAPMPASLEGGAWTSVLAPHSESNFLSTVLALLERPPKSFSV